jgi:RNHCP domain
LSRVKRTRRRQSTFRCRHCRLDVPLDAPGTMHRNHCPSCLWSRHLDEHVPGDRAAACAGSMEPIAVSVRDDGEWAVVHRCRGCATVRANRIAGDDNSHVLMRLAALSAFPVQNPGDAG